MDYFSRKPDFPTFEDIYIARAQGAIGLERREDGLACRFGQDGRHHAPPGRVPG